VDFVSRAAAVVIITDCGGDKLVNLLFIHS